MNSRKYDHKPLSRPEFQSPTGPARINAKPVVSNKSNPYGRLRTRDYSKKVADHTEQIDMDKSWLEGSIDEVIFSIGGCRCHYRWLCAVAKQK
jgi:hypothetical protein